MRGANTLKRGGTFQCPEEIDGIKGEVWHRQYVFLDVHNPRGCGMLTKKGAFFSLFFSFTGCQMTEILDICSLNAFP